MAAERPVAPPQDAAGHAAPLGPCRLGACPEAADAGRALGDLGRRRRVGAAGVRAGLERLARPAGAAAVRTRVLPGAGATGRPPEPQEGSPARLADPLARVDEVAPDGRGGAGRTPRTADPPTCSRTTKV